MSKIIIFSGAGISAQSGISTFRDSGGLWENHKIEDVCSHDSLEKNRDLVIEFYDKRRADIANKQPNYAHLQIAKLQKKYPHDIEIITQNVDDMFEKAGCSDVLHIHGYLRELKCESCNYIIDIEYESQQNSNYDCPQCNIPLRPNIVFFGENAPKYRDLYNSLESCEMFISIGTSGNVVDVSSLAYYAKRNILNNLEPSIAIDEDKFDKCLYKKATEAIDEIIEDIEDFLKSQ